MDIGNKSFKEINNLYKNLPAPGTPLQELNLTQIKSIATLNKCSEYDIKINDIIKINDEINAEIIDIGKDYIELLTVENIISGIGPSVETRLSDRKTVASYGTSAFYKRPQARLSINIRVSYLNSDLRKEISNWAESQSDEFKSILLNTGRRYESSILRFNGHEYVQRTDNIALFAEKIYVPTLKEYKTKIQNVTKIKRYFWLATPSNFSFNTEDDCSFGSFYCVFENEINSMYGNYPIGACVAFRIG